MHIDTISRRAASTDLVNRRMMGAVLFSLLLHALVLSLQFGVAGIGIPNFKPAALSIHLEPLSAPAATPAPALPPLPTPVSEAPAPPAPLPAPAPSAQRDAPQAGFTLLAARTLPTPAKRAQVQQARRISAPTATPRHNAAVRVIAQDQTHASDFNLPPPQPEESLNKTIDPTEAQDGSAAGTEATAGAPDAESLKAVAMADAARKEEETTLRERLLQEQAHEKERAAKQLEDDRRKFAEQAALAQQESARAAALAQQEQAAALAQQAAAQQRQQKAELDEHARRKEQAQLAEAARAVEQQQQELARKEKAAALEMDERKRAAEHAAQERKRAAALALEERQRADEQAAARQRQLELARKAQELAQQEQRAEQVRLQAAEQAAQRKADELTLARKAEELAARQKADELAARQKADELAARRKAEELAARQRAEDAAARQRADDLAARQKAEEANSRQRADQAAKERQAQEAAQKLAAQNTQVGPGSAAGTNGAGDTPSGKAGVPQNLLGRPFADLLREPPRGIGGVLGAPPRALVDAPRDRRRVTLSGAEKDVSLRMYADAWRQKIERNGDLNYSQSVTRRARIDPVVVVSLRSDGSVEEIAIVRSSGRQDMDEAVRRIVRVNARYAAFPPNIAEKYDVIEIRRVWSFDETLKLLEDGY